MEIAIVLKSLKIVLNKKPKKVNINRYLLHLFKEIFVGNN